MMGEKDSCFFTYPVQRAAYVTLLSRQIQQTTFMLMSALLQEKLRMKVANLHALRDMFLRLDKDKDGAVSRGELHFALGYFNLFPTPEALDQLMALLDPEGTGVVRYQDFLARLAPPAPEPAYFAPRRVDRVPDRDVFGTPGSRAGGGRGLADASGRLRTGLRALDAGGLVELLISGVLPRAGDFLESAARRGNAEALEAQDLLRVLRSMYVFLTEEQLERAIGDLGLVGAGEGGKMAVDCGSLVTALRAAKAARLQQQTCQSPPRDVLRPSDVPTERPGGRFPTARLSTGTVKVGSRGFNTEAGGGGAATAAVEQIREKVLHQWGALREWFEQEEERWPGGRVGKAGLVRALARAGLALPPMVADAVWKMIPGAADSGVDSERILQVFGPAGVAAGELPPVRRSGSNVGGGEGLKAFLARGGGRPATLELTDRDSGTPRQEPQSVRVTPTWTYPVKIQKTM